ncbi:Tudor/PWWP/MBT superfamily protein [Abeliophyllum distichum]|uniref:Tudor/PWWP/MBT superfamily protein n=1 Tax=Abeliophyllum distichum TaxID=126358 RepID=A0ABD1VP77_9LAMI
MGSSGEPINKGIDASVGGLVWVRRRNGSWWPGRILSPDELPESSVLSPRSGTPVKLLGREDASVDWYNLEKSKRVKAFRCGEYDECIEKAKATASNSSKKAVKYARREDAILHALELESARLGKDHLDFTSGRDKQGGEHCVVDQSPTSFNPSEGTDVIDEDLSSSEDDSDSAQELSQSGVSFEYLSHLDATKDQSRRRRTPNDSEDDGTEGIKRMRGLEDLGMGVVSSFKRKRSQTAHVHEFLKRKNRRLTLSKVLENTTMVSVPVVSEQLASPTGSSLPGASDSKVSELESNESKKNNSLAINNNSDSTGVSCENGPINPSRHASDDSMVKSKQKENEISSELGLPGGDLFETLFDVPLLVEEKHSAGLSSSISCAFQKAQIGAGAQSSQSSLVETLSLGNEELNESASTSSDTADIHNISQRIDQGTSEWQLKGKRNARSRKVDVNDESAMNVAGRNVDFNFVGVSLPSDGCGYSLKSRPIAEIQVDKFPGWSRNVPRTAAELPVPQRVLPYRQSRFTVNPKYDSSDFSLRHHNVGSVLYDVTLEVKASYRPQHVPYISLMSKLNGRPIIGHPLTIEVLEDGFCGHLISGSECYSSSSDLDDDQGATRPSSGGKISTKHLALQPYVSHSKTQKSRRNGLLSKKIRKLSSLTGSQKRSEEEKKLVVERLRGPAVACVPLNLVFSRINAALGPAHRLASMSNI